jgi:formamidopyrimidine-DNA glycosylase
MEQKKNAGLGSGIGNYLVAEILYDSKISPYMKMIDLFNNKNSIKRLEKSIKYIIKLAFITNKTKYFSMCIKKKNLPNYHPDIIISKNDKFKFKVYRLKIDPFKNPVIGSKIVGYGNKKRTTYWAPNVQTDGGADIDL